MSARRGVRLIAFLVVLSACTREAPTPRAEPTATASAPTPPALGLELVGHEPLLARGMNAGLAVHGRYAYVGSRTDGSAGHPHPGVLVIDIGDPAQPRIVGEIGRPHQGSRGETSRELRVWPEQDLLIVMNVGCAAVHACAGPQPAASLRFYDLRGARARAPMLVATARPAVTPHEMFLWTDPAHRGRALLYVSTDRADPGTPGLLVLDISAARRGSIREVARWSGTAELARGQPDPASVRLHSVGVSGDGTRAYAAHLGGGFVVLDTSALARGEARPEIASLTPGARSLRWAPGPHSAIEVPGSELVLTTDEVYGGGPACPWGWARLVDVASPERPRLVAELRLARNQPSACRDAPADGRYSASAHNPTVAAGVAFVSWHAEGLIAVPVSATEGFGDATAFVPTPLERVATEDPRLTAGPVKVAMWSTPIVWRGMIVVVDLRNGLYVLRYRGPGGEAAARVAFREGNSNVGP